MAIKLSERDSQRLKELVEISPQANATLQAAITSLPKGDRGARLVADLRGRGDVMMTTDEILGLTRRD